MEDLERMVRDYSRLLVRLAFTYMKNVADAEDAVQEVFLTVLIRGQTFQDEEQERAWLIRVTINRCKNMLKAASRKNRSLEEVPESRQAYEQPFDYGVLDGVMQLPERYRGIIHLYYYEGYTQEEIAILLDIPLSTVKTRMVRARKRLRKLLGEEFREGEQTM